MAILINDNYSLQGIKPFDDRYLNISTPWANVAAAKAGIPTYRYTGLTVNVLGVEYWWKNGVGDGDLVAKESSIVTEGITGATNGLTKVGQDVKFGGTTPLNETTNICGATNALNFGTAASKLGAFQINAASVAILATGTTEICSTGALTLDGSAISVKEVASYDSNKSPFTALQIPDAEWVTGCTSTAGVQTVNNGLTKYGTNAVLGGALTGDTTISGDFDLCLGTNASCLNTLQIYTEENITVETDNNLTMSLSGGTITTSDLKGLRYGADYIDTFVDNSLASKLYVDTIASGLDPKSAVLVATTVNITLSDVQTIDSVSLVEGDRVLVKNQTNGETNGIYDVVSGASWTRSSDFDGTTVGEVTQGALIPVLSGDTQINSSWILTTKDPIIVGTTPLAFTKFSQLLDISAGAGIAISTVGETKTVCVHLGSDSGLNTSSGLVVDSSIAGNALSLASGVLNVNASSCGSVGAIPVGYNAGDCLVVACSDISTALNAITGATNGLTKVGQVVILGGALTGDTTISGAYTLALTGATDLSTDTGYQICGVTILRTSTSTISSIYLGVDAGSNGSGVNNVGIGCEALGANTTGYYNVGIGFEALKANTTGQFNLAIGYQALLNNTCGHYNIAQGFEALCSNICGENNLALGYNALCLNTGGTGNIAIGYRAFNKNIIGCYNTAIGRCALNDTVTGCTNVAIGDNAGYNETGSNKLHIANSSSCSLISGDFVAKTVTLDAKLTLGQVPTVGALTDVVLVRNSGGEVKTVTVASLTGATTITANNGLTKVGDIISLGGALTGDTTISGAHTLALSSLTAFNATATDIGLTGAVGVVGAIDAESTLDILGATYLQDTLDVTGATTIGGAVTLTSVAAGSVSTDEIMVITGGGVVKKIAADTVGEDNNIYNKTIVSANATGTTASTYVQLISGATTFTLPASPQDGQAFKIKDACGNALAAPIIVDASSGLTIDGSQCALINTDYGALELVYGATNEWFSLAFVN